MSKAMPLMSTDFGPVALLRQGHIFQIGEVRADSYKMDLGGQMVPCKTLIWEFFEDGEKDYIFFDQEGEFLFGTVSENRPDYIIRIYSKLFRTGANLSTWCNLVQSEFIVTELGF